MLKNLNDYSNDIEKFILNCENEEYLKYWVNSTYFSSFSSSKSSHGEIGRAILDRDDNLLGYIKAGIDREYRTVESLAFINTTKKPNLTFAKDSYKFIIELFTKYNFLKIKFFVVVGNPAESIYDRLIEKLNGRVVGIFKEDVMLYDYKYYDIKHYEILKSNFDIKRGNEK